MSDDKSDALQSIKEQQGQIGKFLVTHGEALQHFEGSFHAIYLAVQALVRSHPDPERFALEFRRSVLQDGSPQSDAEFGAIALDGISEILDMLERSCSAPLKVRPPKAE